MTSQAIEGACAFAWRNYFLLHSGVGEGYGIPTSLDTSPKLRDAGEYFDLLQIATVAYLKKLDELHDERREARGRSGFGRVLSVSQSRPLALALTVGAEGASSHGRQNPYLRSSRARRPKAYDRNRIDPSNSSSVRYQIKPERDQPFPALR
jgi:hypothetical protein